MSSSFDTVPAAAQGKPTPFALHISGKAIEDFHTLLRLSPIGRATWWTEHGDGHFGITREWLIKAKAAWLQLEWRKTEERINAVPNFKISIRDEQQEHDIHFAALFSSRPDAIPVIMLHGWPGSFLEFLPLLELVVEKYTPDTLPYHFIVPSIPEYGLSTSSGSTDTEMTMPVAARVMNQLMVELGFGTGYLTHGGDVGSMLSIELANSFKECKAYHLNLLTPDEAAASLSLDGVTSEERAQLERGQSWRKTGMAYALEHGTRPATIGAVLSSSPLAALAWVGEKYLEWVDHNEPLSLDTILSMVSFYWFTETLPRSFYPYRYLVSVRAGSNVQPQTGRADGEGALALPKGSIEKPLGISAFPGEMLMIPKAWAEKVYPNLVMYKRHPVGGHFAALEQPKAMLDDIEEFIQRVRAQVNIVAPNS